MEPLDTRHLDWLRMQAWVFLQYGQLERAHLLLQLLLEHDPGCKQGLKMMALVLLELDRPKEAVKILKNLAQDSQELHEQVALWQCLSRAQWRLGNIGPAKQAHKQYVAGKQMLTLGKALDQNHE